jgi:hypothetical protein
MDQPIEEEWRNYELHEKVRIRDQKKRFWTITLAVSLFLGLCAVPVVRERLPKWRGLDAARVISLSIEAMKTRAIREKKPLRIRFTGEGTYRIEVLNDCKDQSPLRFDADSPWPDRGGALRVLSRADLEKFSIGQGVESICFDPVFGLAGGESRQVLVVVPVKDLSEGRLDRASYVLIEGESAKISIN